MIKQIWNIFKRDLRVNSRDFLTLYIALVPLLIAFGINAFAPGINDTTINLALLEGENINQVEYFEEFAKVELYKDVESLQKRVEARDNIVGILPDGDEYYIMSQGNEPDSVVDFAKLLKSLYEIDITVEDSTAKIVEFGQVVPPLKKILTNVMILFTSILGGMVIAFNIIEEKADKTIRAISVTPVSKKTFILGKSVMGLVLPIFGSIGILLITGFGDVNFWQVILILIASTLISLIIGFIQGVNNDDVMSAAASIKLLFIPLVAAIVAVEILDKWQILFYWIPFYWAYKGNDAVLSYSSSWGQILSYTGIVLVVCGIIYLVLAPKIREGLK